MVDYGQRSHKRTRTRLRKKHKLPIPLDFSNIFVLDRIVKIAFFGLLTLIILIPALFLWYGRDLPSPGKIVVSKYGNATRIYDRSSTLLYSVYQDENRTYTKLADIPVNLQHATIAIEDKDFYNNKGFSPIGYVRVLWNFVRGRGLGGASTITQQLVKNVLLSSERTIPRKIKELILSVQIDQRFSKDQILEMYFNNIPYGGSSIGVEAASEMYFGKKVKNLDLAQSAFLAGLVQAPSLYSPFSGHKYYLARTQAVLKQMVNDKYVTQPEADKALAEIKNYQFTQNNATGIKAPHFVMYVKELLAKQFGEKMVESGGLQVTTTLSYDIEKHAEDIVDQEISKLGAYNVSNGAAVVMDPKTGEILAMVGSKDYFDTKNDGNFNAALSHRQPGSSLKPVTYAVAFEKGYTPGTMVMDVRTDFKPDDATPDYMPVNYDGKYRGPVQLRFALGNSLNIPAVKMLARVGIKPVMQLGYEMGLENWQPTPENLKSVGYSLVLGGREVTLLNEATAYSVFADQGVHHDPVAILKVTDSQGHVLYQYKPTQGQKLLPPEITFLISHILLDNNARMAEFGPNSWLVVPGKTVSVKTGTTDDKRDNWTVGYTPSYVVGVWVGNNDNSPMNQAIASGITGASPIWNKIMTYVLKGKPDEPPQKPDNVIAMQIDSLFGGLPYKGQPTRSEYFVKGTEPTAVSPVYQEKDGKTYYVIHEDDPISTDGKNRWQEGIDAWIKENHSAADQEWYPPEDVVKRVSGATALSSPTPTASPGGDTPTPTDSPTPTP